MHSGIAPCFRALIILLIASFAAAKSNAQGTGEIQIFKASGLPAEIIRTNGTIIPARIGEYVANGDCVKTPARSYLTLLLSNGALLGIQPSTELLIETFLSNPFGKTPGTLLASAQEPANSRTKLDLKNGLLFLNTPTLNQRSRFEITTPLGGAGVRGTEFFVLAATSRAAVGVTQGLVLTTDRSGQTTLLPSGKAVSLSLDGFSPPSPSDLELLTQTRANFKNIRRQNPPDPNTPAPPAQTPAPKSRAGYNLVN